MRYRMLIIDDDMPPIKGYRLIGEWFPDVFEIDETKSFIACERFKNPDVCASALLASRGYDVILVDFNFELDDFSGPEVVAAVRLGSAKRCPAIRWEGMNRSAYIIGVSDGWSEAGLRTLRRCLDLRGLDHGLDGIASKPGIVALQLREELQKFLASREHS